MTIKSSQQTECPAVFSRMVSKSYGPADENAYKAFKEYLYKDADPMDLQCFLRTVTALSRRCLSGAWSMSVVSRTQANRMSAGLMWKSQVDFARDPERIQAASIGIFTFKFQVCSNTIVLDPLDLSSTLAPVKERAGAKLDRWQSMRIQQFKKQLATELAECTSRYCGLENGLLTITAARNLAATGLGPAIVLDEAHVMETGESVECPVALA